ncbi:hypothetical protein [Streptomyces phytophilus]|uniref:hypothetical protein n=1 Tax=Streptomyces phytophilus TaxID=722715 RepID=UPI0015F0AE6A|nr:hypothetical protein [Streptomyces phytophilus]
MKGQRHYLRGYVLRAEDDEAEGAGEDGKPLRIVAATAGMKGDGLNLQMAGADLGRFQANPVVGYGHMYWGRESLPIGRSEKTWIDDDRLMMDVGFDQEDDFARTVERKYRGGYLNAFSIGFDVWDIDDAGVPAGWELFEVSAVPLPMDPNAVVESGRDEQLAMVRTLVGDRPDAEAFAQAVMAQLGELQGKTPARAGKVLSSKNKKLVSDAVKALQALLEAAGGTDDEDDTGDEDEGRQAPGTPPAPQGGDELTRLRAANQRLARLAGVG